MRVHCGFVPATSSVVYVPVPSVYNTWFFPGTRPYGYAARHFVAVTSFTEGDYMPATSVCACCTWLGLRCTFLTCPCAYCPWFCPRYTSLSPISLFPDCAAHDLVNYCCFYNNYPQHDPRVSLNIKGVNFSPVINVHKTIRPTGWLYLLLKEAYHKLPRKPKDEN